MVQFLEASLDQSKRNTESLNMQTAVNNIDSLFSPAVQYQVPLYQRRYVWDKTNWSVLWNDILSQADLGDKDSRHFIGAIVTRPIKSNRLPRFEVIDGQQRLATFQIILCAIRDICQLEGFNEITEEVNHHILNSQIVVAGDTPDARYKFLPILGDKDAFCSIIDGRHIRNSHHLISQAYNYFKAQINAYVARDSDKLEKLLDSFIYNFTVVKIMVNPSDSPETIFTSLNTGGRSLSQFDLLRNDIFLRAGADIEKLYHAYWTCFEDPFWKSETFDEFLRGFLTAKLGIKIETDNLFNVYVQQYRSTLKAEQSVEQELSELKRHAEIYREKIKHDV